MAGCDERQAQVLSKIVSRDRRSTDFQTRLERHFTPGRLGDQRYGRFGNLRCQKRDFVQRDTGTSRLCKSGESQA